MAIIFLGVIFLKIKLLNNSIINEDIDDKSNEVYINKKSYLSTIILLKTIIALVYAFYLGYNIFNLGENFFTYAIKFAIVLFIIYLFIDIPYNLFKIILFIILGKKDFIIYLNPFNLAIDICFDNEISKKYVLLVNIITMIVFSLTSNILLFLNGFNIYTYALASAISIFIIKDLIYSILLIAYGKENIISTPKVFKNIK